MRGLAPDDSVQRAACRTTRFGSHSLGIGCENFEDFVEFLELTAECPEQSFDLANITHIAFDVGPLSRLNIDGRRCAEQQRRCQTDPITSIG